MWPWVSALGALLCALAPSPAAARPTALRGVVEGYYGRPWPAGARQDVIRFLGARQLDTFVYAPKNDDFHRLRWREPYPAASLAELEETARVAKGAGVRFIYALSPVLDVCYSCKGDLRALRTKLRQLQRARVRDFALLFDDGGAVSAPEDVARYGGSDAAALARAQADLTNRTHRWLRARGLRGIALVVPSQYAGNECTPYHEALAASLNRRIPVAWTGANVLTAVITAPEAEARAACVGHPVVLWDNFPVNDVVLSNNLHLGPLTGRDPALVGSLRGYLLNPMTQPYASLIPLATAAAYLHDPEGYDPEASWQAALLDFGGGGPGLGVLAAQTRSSVLDLSDAHALTAAVDALEVTYQDSTWAAAVGALEREEQEQAAAPSDIETSLAGTPFAAEIAPWVRELEAHAVRGLEAVRLLRALKPALEVTAAPDPVGLHVQGQAHAADVATAAVLGPSFADEATTVAARIAEPPIGPFSRCLGDALGADITFCPQYGLNVHGKALYLLVGTAGISVVSDRNQHDRLILATGAAYERWSARRGPGADELTLFADGVPLVLAPDGTFDAVVPAAGGQVTLLVTTAAGEATALTVR